MLQIMNYFLFKIKFKYKSLLTFYMCDILANVLPVHTAQITKPVRYKTINKFSLSGYST